MARFSANPYFIYQRLECYTTLIVKELLYNKNQFFTFISESFVTYITITVTNISNNIIKQYYGIIKLFKVLVIVKKKPELIFLFGTGLSRLISKLSLISRIYLWCPYTKMVNSSKDGISLQLSRWSRIALSFDGLTKCQGGYPNMFSRLNFQVSLRLTVIGRIVPSTRIFINHPRH